ncbi:unnamed protein product [Polarella glacialis]|uniref:Calmodulin-lysine N-methyltransferase n=1 Tax=Polarella glacialis TaxID=89957 RepID=A0A813LYM3_POLGL|nr:unnamed protein product [Polarella glacialis]
MTQQLSLTTQSYEHVGEEVTSPRNVRDVGQPLTSTASSGSMCILRRAKCLAAAAVVGFLGLLATLAVLGRSGMGPVSFNPDGTMQLVGELGDVCRPGNQNFVLQTSLDYTLIAKGGQTGGTANDDFKGNKRERIVRTQAQIVSDASSGDIGLGVPDLAWSSLGQVLCRSNNASDLGHLGDICSELSSDNVKVDEGNLVFRSYFGYTLRMKGSEENAAIDGFAGKKHEHVERTQEQFVSGTSSGDNVQQNARPNRHRSTSRCRDALVCRTSQGGFFGRCALPTSMAPTTHATTASEPGTLPSARGGPHLYSAVQLAIKGVLDQESQDMSEAGSTGRAVGQGRVAGRQLLLPRLEGLSEEAAEDVQGTGRSLWDTAPLMASYLERQCSNSELFRAVLQPASKQARCVELGSGLGLVGMAAAVLWPHLDVLLTDLQELLPTMKASLAANNLSNARAAAYAWGQRSSPEPADLVLASDVLWREDQVSCLLGALEAVTKPGGLALIGFQRRVPRIEKLLRRGLQGIFGSVEDVPPVEMHPTSGDLGGRICLLLCSCRVDSLATRQSSRST